MNKLVERIELELDEIVADIFEAMTDVTCTPSSAVGTAKSDVAMAVHFHGGMRGSCLLTMTSSAALAYAGVMLGTEAEQRGDWLGDAASELCNMIAGGWKSLQPPPPGQATMSPPLAHSTLANEDGGNMRVRRSYQFGMYGFGVELALCPEDAAALQAALRA